MTSTIMFAAVFTTDSPEHVNLVVNDIFNNWKKRSNDRKYNALFTVHVGGNKASTPRAMEYFDKFAEENENRPADKRLKVLSTRKDRKENPHAVLVPGGVAGVWICGALGFLVVLIGIILSFFPPGETNHSRIRIAVGWWNGRIHPDRPVSLLARRPLKKGHLSLGRSLCRKTVWTSDTIQGAIVCKFV